MAKLDAIEGDETFRRRRHRRHSEIDWPRTHDTTANSPPRPPPRRGEILRPDVGRDLAHGRPPLARASLSSSSSMRVPNSTMPLLVRPSTARTTKLPPYDDHLSRSDSRRTHSHRDRDSSPPSARQYRSTPETRRSSRTSVTDSDAETSSATESTEDEKDDDILPDKEALRDRINNRRGDRRPQREEEEDSAVIYEEERRHHRHHRHHQHRHHDDRHRREPSPEEDRSPSRHSHRSRHSPDRRSHRHHHASRHDHSKVIRVEDEGRRHWSPAKRSSRRYYESEAPMVYVDRAPSLRRSHTTGGSHLTSSQSVSSSRRSSLLGSFFGVSHQSHAPEKPVKIVTCVVCLDELPSTKTARLKCAHRMCNGCLKRSFKLSITDPQHMPPKCCTADVIPLKHVDKLLDTNFKKAWNKKFREFSTRNRIYCPSRRCGEWIKPENISREDGRKVARCGRCKTKVCGVCNGKWHSSRECPRDEETNQFLEQAKQEGWQRCHRCKAMVELKEGCNHMTCRCGAEFCMICGAKWKSCECPWFNFEAVEGDRLEHMQIPLPARDRFDLGPRDYLAPGLGGPGRHRPPQTYEEERLRRRLQEQDDEVLARRLQTFGSFDDDDTYQGRIGDITGIGNQAGHFMNEDYRRRPENMPAPPPPPAPAPVPAHAPTFERASTGTDYVSDVNRARGVRGSSMERRLADRFNTDHRTSPVHRQTAPPPPTSPGAMPPMAGMPPPMGGMPMMTAPPRGSAAGPPAVLRRHTMEDELYNSSRSTRSSERRAHKSRRDTDDVENTGRTSSSRRRHREEPPKMSVLAGLTGPGRGMNRVFEWRDHVEPGVPDGEGPLSAL